MRYILIIMISVSLVLLAPAFVLAGSANGPAVKVNGEIVDFSNYGSSPYVSENNNTMVPLRVISEEMKCEVEWEREERAAVIDGENDTASNTVKFFVDKRKVMVNGKEVPVIGSGAVLQDGRVFIPVRLLGNHLGWSVIYSNKDRPVISIFDDPNAQVKRESRNIVSRGGESFRYVQKMKMISTAYTYTGNNTCTGIEPHRGVIAVDPELIPFGTRMYVEGYGFGVAQDKGSAIKGKRIDVFVESRSKALSWGKKEVNVYILER